METILAKRLHSGDFESQLRVRQQLIEVARVVYDTIHRNGTAAELLLVDADHLRKRLGTYITELRY